MSVFNGPGRGRKFCEACQNYVGVRSRVCPSCGAVFGSSLPIRRELNPVPQVLAGKVTTDVPKFSMPKSPEDSEGEGSGKSRADRIASLKEALIRELKLSAPSFSASVVAEISSRVVGG